jgi:hypothetical protein
VTTDTKQATGSFQVTGWDEKPYETLKAGGKLTRASVTGTISGEISGEVAVEWLMAYADDEHATFVGVQLLTGEIASRAGTVAMSMTGTFEDGVARATWTVVAGTGSGDLTGITGDGDFLAPQGGEASATLSYAIPAA